ncbi:hypothetical protein Sjap_002278 [Stephania japonica]|uniref:Uncharacterized protein n=1 Tax=Stephania japonica TaxID=461633 RepID=A0AAP0KLM2_9MAGN
MGAQFRGTAGARDLQMGMLEVMNNLVFSRANKAIKNHGENIERSPRYMSRLLSVHCPLIERSSRCLSCPLFVYCIPTEWGLHNAPQDASNAFIE